MTDAEIQVEIAKQIRDKLAPLATKLRETAQHNGPPDKENAESYCRRDRQTRVTLVRPGNYWNKLGNQYGGSAASARNGAVFHNH